MSTFDVPIIYTDGQKLTNEDLNLNFQALVDYVTESFGNDQVVQSVVSRLEAVELCCSQNQAQIAVQGELIQDLQEFVDELKQRVTALEG